MAHHEDLRDGFDSLLQKQQAVSLLDTIIKESSAAFDVIDRDPRKRLMAGYVSALAVVQLTGLRLARVKEVHTSALNMFEREGLKRALAQGSATSRSRFSVGQNFTGNIWGLLNNALLARQIAEDFAAQERGSEPRESLYATNVANVVLGRLSTFIEGYASASPDDLRAAGILDAVSAVDPVPSGTTLKLESRGRLGRVIRNTALLIAALVLLYVLIRLGGLPFRLD